ncbi:MAG TPA: hypothetical protein GXX75_19665 [Clostridiales bacterium]|nr:hypothetical protein [Clostridiales bacterium]
MRKKILIFSVIAMISSFAVIAFWGFVAFVNTPSSVEEVGNFTFVAAGYHQYKAEQIRGLDSDYYQVDYVVVVDGNVVEIYRERVGTLEIAERAVENKQTKQLKKFLDSTGEISYVKPELTEEEYLHDKRKWLWIWIPIEIGLLVFSILAYY